jgi:threonine/homoserine/homoserine lactone efflux protein
MLTAFISAFIMSFVGSMPPTGPIAMITLDRGIHGHFRNALFVVIGAVCAEAVWAALAYLGITYFFSSHPRAGTTLRVTAALLLIVFAIVTIIQRRSHQSKEKPRTYSGRSFLLGLSVAGLNPTFLVTWSAGVAVIRGLGFELPVGAAPAFALGVAAGPVAWYSIVIKLLSLHRHRLKPEMLGIISKILPFILLSVAVILLVQALKPLLH